jgi:hypothetical protein
MAFVAASVAAAIRQWWICAQWQPWWWPQNFDPKVETADCSVLVLALAVLSGQRKASPRPRG